MSYLKTILMILAGNLLVALATVLFILPENILCGGVTTVAIVLNTFIPLSRVMLISLINILLYLLGTICLGKKFALSSLLSTFVYPLLVSLLSMVDLQPFSKVDPLLASLYAGILLGAGLGLVFRVNASTGGMDIPALIIHKYLRIPQGQSVMIVDTLTILSGIFTFGLNSVLTGLIAVMSSSFMINRMQTLGSQAAQNVLIISEKWPEIQKYLLTVLDRGVTVLEGEGAWSHEKRPVLMCVIKTRDYATLQRGIEKIDPRAFIIVSDVHEVRGSGFTYEDSSTDAYS